ncbi:hypothetical protein Y032_0045g1239 [Ancylostoma ceylanicum]|nr:hypothetical protein Y032_0045g1239 [Ancylostoma ceylanicum]
MVVKHHYDNASWIHNRESAYLQPSQMHLNASNPFYVDAIGNSYRKYLDRLDKIVDRLRTSMNDIFFKDVFVEFMTDYVNPFYDDLKSRAGTRDGCDACAAADGGGARRNVDELSWLLGQQEGGKRYLGVTSRAEHEFDIHFAP